MVESTLTLTHRSSFFVVAVEDSESKEVEGSLETAVMVVVVVVVDVVVTIVEVMERRCGGAGCWLVGEGGVDKEM